MVSILSTQTTISVMSTPITTDALQPNDNTTPLPSTETCKNTTKWLVDSGATCHCTFNKSLFTSYIPLNSQEKISVTVANGALVETVGIGDVCFRTNQGINLVLKSVRHIPGLNQSLISVPTLDEQGYTSLFHRGNYILKRDSVTVAKVRKIGKQYFVEGTVTSDYDPMSELWHKRLGHLNSSGLEKLFKKKHLIGLENPVTDQCVYCPSTRSVYKQCSGKSGFLEFVHVAYRGPFYKPSLNGAVYFVTFIDDYSGKVWCYALKKKIEAVNAFKNFRSNAETYTRKRVQCIFDSQPEDYNSALQKYCTRHNIQYLSTLPRALSVNNLAETTSNNIRNKIDYILANAKLPQIYWEFAMDATVHVLNLCPMTNLNNDVPNRIWYGKDAEYDHLRVFGCRAVVRERECIFVGYAENGVGYKFYDPVKMEVVLGSDAEFFEEESILDIDVTKTTTTKSTSSLSVRSGNGMRSVRKFLGGFFRGMKVDSN